MISLAFMAGSALAKLPPPTPEAAEAAAAAKDKAAWADKVAAFKLCQAQDRLAKQYLKDRPDAKKPTVETPPCADPGPYVPGAATAAAATPAPASTPAPAAGAAPAPAQAAAAPANAQPAPAKK